MTLTVAHFSDVHLAPVPVGEAFADFRFKRLVGIASWHLHRKHCHSLEIANALRADIRAAAPDHVCCTGDMVNIASYGEFQRGTQWLKDLGDGGWLSLVPGNHDAYVTTDPDRSTGLWTAYFTGGSFNGSEAGSFPFVRLRRNVAIIGLTSAQPQSLARAGGTLGPAQLRDLALQLEDLGKRGFYRLVMIHHPPLPGLTIPARALTDAEALQDVLKDKGAEFVLHGHNHIYMLNSFATRSGMAHACATPSGSMTSGHRHDVAAWHLYRISRAKGFWQTDVSIRQWQQDKKAFEEVRTFTLTSATQPQEQGSHADHS
ncbi:MAG: metallophosphoesterase [Proteobacteria bacterium]|nr:metallophosphoesterase [Pseudomonadota bacterium]